MSGLTDRQVEVLAAYMRTGRVKEAAAALGLAQQTVKTHLQHVYDTLGVGGATEAAMALGWLRVPDQYRACGWVGMCTRPEEHRGHHGGWTGVVQGRQA